MTDAAAPPDRSVERRWGPVREELLAAAELFAISGLAIAQPAFDVLSKNVSLLVERDTTPWQVVALTLWYLVVPAAVAYVVEVAVGLVAPRLRRWAHAGLVGVFAAVLFEEVAKHAFGLHGGAAIAVGVVGGIAAVVLVLGAEVARTFLRFLAIAPIGFAIIFLAFSPVAKTVFEDAPPSASGATIGNPTRVVMIVMDEFPLGTLLDGSGHVDAALYPHFAELAATSNWYRNTTTVAPYTDWAVPALATGRYPVHQDTIPTAADYPDSIFRLLGGAYRMNVHEPVTKLCPSSYCTDATSSGSPWRNLAVTIKDSFDLWRDFAEPSPAPPAKFEPPPSVPSGVLGGRRFVRSLRPGTERRFDYLHVMLPHQPWHYLPSLQDSGYIADDLATKANLLKWGDQPSADIGRERHILQSQAADTILGQIMDRLKKLGAWDDSLVVLTADHGVSFTVGDPIRSATEQNADQLLWVPMFVKLPGQAAPLVDDRPMETIDIVPTIADVLDAKIPWKVDGVSALGTARKEFDRRLYEYKLAHLQPPGSLISEDGEALHFDPAPLWPQVMARQAAAPVGEPSLRPYRIGEYADLVGRPAAPLVSDDPGGPTGMYVLNRNEFDDVDPFAPVASWTSIQGSVLQVREQQPIAFAVNGTIAGFGWATPYRDQTTAYYWASLAPQFFRPGANELTAYMVSGPASDPVLDPVPIDPGAPAAAP